MVRRRLAFEENPAAFRAQWARREERLAGQLAAARALPPQVDVGEAEEQAACLLARQANAAGHRAELAILHTARALAALAGRTYINLEDLHTAAELALPHRRREGNSEGPPPPQERGEEPPGGSGADGQAGGGAWTGGRVPPPPTGRRRRGFRPPRHPRAAGAVPRAVGAGGEPLRGESPAHHPGPTAWPAGAAGGAARPAPPPGGAGRGRPHPPEGGRFRRWAPRCGPPPPISGAGAAGSPAWGHLSPTCG